MTGTSKGAKDKKAKQVTIKPKLEKAKNFDDIKTLDRKVTVPTEEYFDKPVSINESPYKEVYERLDN